MTTFQELGLSEKVLSGLDTLGYKEATPVQAQSIPFLLKSEGDLVALAQTGTGKTAAFGLPIIDKIDPKSTHIQALILCPTRELCMQTAKNMKAYASCISGLKVTAVFGGERIDVQLRALKQNPQIIVSTPGRLMDIINRKKIDLESITWLVLDEADEMLNMGFKEDLDFILEHTGAKTQTLLFSATMPKEIERISGQYMNKPERIEIAQRNEASNNVTHHYFLTHAKDRFAALKRIVDMNPDIYGIIFCRTRNETADVADKLLAAHYKAEAIHGELSQSQRDHVMKRFRAKKVHLLVATDVAARGIDIAELTHVINYVLPDSNEVYVHRSGRTGRAGNSGVSLSIINMREQHKIKALERTTKKAFIKESIPTGEDVCKAQLLHIIDDLVATDPVAGEMDQYLPHIYEKLEHLDRESLIKKLVSVEFGRFLEFYKNAPDLNANAAGGRERVTRERAGSYSNFAINIGSKHGFTKKDLLNLINKHPIIKQADIGTIDVKSANTIFEIEESYGPKVADAFHKVAFEGIPLVVNPSRVAPTRERREFSGGGGGRGGSRRSGGGDRGGYQGSRSRGGDRGGRGGSSSTSSRGGDRGGRGASRSSGGERSRRA